MSDYTYTDRYEEELRIESCAPDGIYLKSSEEGNYIVTEDLPRVLAWQLEATGIEAQTSRVVPLLKSLQEGTSEVDLFLRIAAQYLTAVAYYNDEKKAAQKAKDAAHAEAKKAGQERKAKIERVALALYVSDYSRFGFQSTWEDRVSSFREVYFDRAEAALNAIEGDA